MRKIGLTPYTPIHFSTTPILTRSTHYKTFIIKSSLLQYIICRGIGNSGMSIHTNQRIYRFCIYLHICATFIWNLVYLCYICISQTDNKNTYKHDNFNYLR